MSKYANIQQIKEVIRTEWVRYMPMELDISLSFVLGKISEVPTIEVSEDCISREDAVNALIAHFIPQTYTGEQVEQASKLARKIMANVPSVIPTNENEIKLCRNCDNAYLYQDCLYCDEIEEETEIEPDDACSLWKLRESSVKPKEGEWKRICPARIYECSACGGLVITQEIECYKYCHQCGAKMNGEEQ